MSRSKALSIKAFVPARDLAVSRAFYKELGFHELWGDASACALQIDDCGFILQQFYVPEHAGNFMMSLAVEDLDAWWARLQRLDLKQRYALGMVRPPALQPWGGPGPLPQ